jgi:hypothetical protein
MQIRSFRFWIAPFIILICFAGAAVDAGDEKVLPAFGRDTVLVWKIQNMDYSAGFVVRIAQFLPDRYMEWENELSQGTVFMPGSDIEDANGYNNSSLFKSGSDTRGNRSTTLWLSRKIFRDLKANKKAKCLINETAGLFTYTGDDTLTVEVNRVSQILPVMKVMDDRKEERWFLDQEDNPLMLSHRVRKFSQTLTSITTDKSNTLRWIKGRKLENPPR